MYHLTVLSDEIPLPPSSLRPSNHIPALTQAIENKYIDRVIPNIGLVLAFYDIISVNDCFIFPGDFRDSFGEPACSVQFRLVTFKPAVGELLQGRIIQSTTTGVRVSLRFFNDVEVPAHELLQPAVYDGKRKIWLWQHGEEFFGYEVGVDVVVKVKSVEVSTAVGLGDRRVASQRHKTVVTPGVSEEAAVGHKSVPMLVIGSMGESGLGPLNWWGPLDE